MATATWREFRGPDGRTVRAVRWDGTREHAWAITADLGPGARLDVRRPPIGRPRRAILLDQPDGSTLRAHLGYWLADSGDRVLPCHPDHFAAVYKPPRPA